MRAQPENITVPEKIMETLAASKKWGTDYSNKTKVPVWRFDFIIEQPAVFHDGESELGYLMSDSHGIPIITGLDEWSKVPNAIEISSQFRNIYFEVLKNDT